jgi:hypothetical protein
LAGQTGELSFELISIDTSTVSVVVPQEIFFSEAACFLASTRIATPAGDVPIERLAVGDMVLTARGGACPIVWIGYRHLDLTLHPTPARVQPILIHAGAFADGVPRRDLFLSPDHAVLRNGALVPARLLVNGASIQRDTGCCAVTYYHVELDAHDLLLAENLPAESYLDTGNRGWFENAGVPFAAASGLHQRPRAARDRVLPAVCR